MKTRPPLVSLRRTAAAILIGFLLTGCSSDRSLNETLPRSEFRRMTVGLCEDYPEESRSIAHARRELTATLFNERGAQIRSFPLKRVEGARKLTLQLDGARTYVVVVSR